jgi:hypothetical protein
MVANSKQIAVQKLYMPRVTKGLSAHEFSSLRQHFCKKLTKIFDNFYDFKISSQSFGHS